MHAYLLVAAGGALGALARFGVGRLLGSGDAAGFPWPTFWVNVGGCVLIGLVFGLEVVRPWHSENLRLGLGVGFLGAFTTFSTFGHETLSMVQRGQWGLAGAYVGASLLVAFLGLVLGVLLGSFLARS